MLISEGFQTKNQGSGSANAKRVQFTVVTFGTAVAASAEAAIAAAAVTQAWSDRDRLDQNCSATMKVDYLKFQIMYSDDTTCTFSRNECGQAYPQVETIDCLQR